MRVRRTFTNEFKREVVELVVSGKVSQLEMSRKYGISPVVISRWKNEYQQGKFFENTSLDTTRLEIKLRELERLIGELTVENRTLKKIIELVEPQKKSKQQIFTSRDWEMSRKDVK
ncbi:MAG: transposase [Actinobacteria bacterium]|nr:transposase [Actinomycetota bacterium]